MVQDKSLKLKRISAGFYRTADGLWEVIRTVYPHDGSVWWYWISGDGKVGGQDHFPRKADAIVALTFYLGELNVERFL